VDTAALERAAEAAERAADRAREEIAPRFRAVAVETKADGSPVTEADRAAERAIRAVLREATPEYGILGEEYGEEGAVAGDRPHWVIDPIDGTIGFSRGIALYSTIIALVEAGESVLGLIDVPGLDERTLGWKGGGCRRNGTPVRVSREERLKAALVSHGDPVCFDLAGRRPAFERMARELPFLRGYTDAFGHAQVIGGGVDAMVDCDLNPWDAAATEILVREAGGVCHVERRERDGKTKLDLVFGNAALVEQLRAFLAD
jgi:histidinol-phosphatase